MSDAANVIVGSGTAYYAPKGTALPSLTTIPSASTWTSAGFTPFGYTDDGVQFTHTPTFKEIEVDEEMAAIDNRLIKEKLEVGIKLAESTLLNLAVAIPGSTLTEGPTTSTLTVGSPSNPELGEYVLAFQGPAPGSETNAGTLGRVIVVYRVKNTAAVTHHAQRKDKVIYAVKFDAMADSSKSAGQRLYEVIDYNPAGS
jgi:hypothetical protein